MLQFLIAASLRRSDPKIQSSGSHRFRIGQHHVNVTMGTNALSLENNIMLSILGSSNSFQ